MIQRYKLDHYEGVMETDVDGKGIVLDGSDEFEYYKCADIDPLIEWRDMTYTCRPKENVNCIVWQLPTFITCAVMHWELESGGVKWRHHLNFKHYWSDDQMNGSKWIPMLPNPWSKK